MIEMDPKESQRSASFENRYKHCFPKPEQNSNRNFTLLVLMRKCDFHGYRVAFLDYQSAYYAQ